MTVPDAAIKAAAEHDHSGPDSACPACQPLTEVLRDRMRWPSLHWGELHPDAYPSLARAVHEAGYVHLEAAMPAIREALAQEIEAMSILDTDRQQPRTLGAKQVRGRAARIIRGGTP